MQLWLFILLLHSVIALLQQVGAFSGQQARSGPSSGKKQYTSLSFTGGGIYYWWQSGFARYLLEHGFAKYQQTQGIVVKGTSAGALTATMLVTKCDFEKAAAVAIALSEREGVFEKPLGLAFVWGDIVREWLDLCIEDDKASEHAFYSNSRQRGVLEITATPVVVPFAPKQVIIRPRSKIDAIAACMASVHIPFFLDGKPNAIYDGKAYVDGSFWQFVLGANSDYFLNKEKGVDDDNPCVVDWTKDLDFYQTTKLASFLSLVSPQGLRDMMDAGYCYCAKLHARGEVPLPPLVRKR